MIVKGDLDIRRLIRNLRLKPWRGLVAGMAAVAAAHVMSFSRARNSAKVHLRLKEQATTKSVMTIELQQSKRKNCQYHLHSIARNVAIAGYTNVSNKLPSKAIP
jgi:hypothetical protein